MAKSASKPTQTNKSDSGRNSEPELRPNFEQSQWEKEVGQVRARLRLPEYQD